MFRKYTNKTPCTYKTLFDRSVLIPWDSLENLSAFNFMFKDTA